MKEKMPLFIAGGLALALVLWMLSGASGEKKESAPEATKAAEARPLFKVRAIASHASPIVRETVVAARTAPDREATLRSEASGTVQELGAARGSRMREGALIAALDVRDRAARVAQAKAAVQAARIESEAARRLSGQGLQSESQAATAETTLEAANAALTLAELDLENARIEAPFDSWLAERMVEVGDFLQHGDTVARIVDLDPIVISGFLTENEVTGIEEHAPATATLATGEVLHGQIRYVAPDSDPQSRMFRVEMEAPNPDAAIRAGVTAQLVVPHETVMAHLISPAHLSLMDTGDVGVLLADEDGLTRFTTVTVVKQAPDGIWVGGLPDTVNIVTVGKDFVRPGDRVDVVLQQPAEEE